MSHGILHIIPLRDIASGNKLYVDYAENPQAGAGGCLRGYSPELSFWRDVAGAVERRVEQDKKDLWGDVLQDVKNTSIRAGTAGEAIEKLERAQDETVLFVITGQQPGLLGGPLLAVYKALTAVRFAEWLQSRLSTPALPLFWIAADDSDFVEIRSLRMLTPDLSPLSTSLSDKAHRPGLPVGDIPVEFATEAWKNLTAFVEAFPKGGRIREGVDRALSQAEDNAGLFASLLSLLVGGGLAFVDGRSEQLRRFSRELFSDYLDREEEVKRMVIERGGRLERSGYHAQLSPGGDSGIFLLENGTRLTVPPNRIPHLRNAVDNAVENCSPGVILRNLMQDSVFRPAAVVLGPAETAYRAQMADVYEMFGIPRPCEIPRLTATYIPPPLSALPGLDGTDAVASLVLDPSRFTAEMFDRATPPEVRAAFKEYRDRVARAEEDIRRATAETVPQKLHKRLGGRLADIRRRVDRVRDIENEAGKLLALEKHPYLSGVAQAVRPDGKLQERVISCLTPFLFAGEEAGTIVRQASERHLSELLDGTPRHIVYSA